jgi:hypothetical protein
MSVPSVFGLPHLSEDAVAAFADGVLSPSAAARAQRHCLECQECAAAVRGQREAAMMLRSAAAPSLPSGLLARLAGVPMSTSLPGTSGGLPTALDEDGVPVFVSYRPANARNNRAGTAKSIVDHPVVDQRAVDTSADSAAEHAAAEHAAAEHAAAEHATSEHSPAEHSPSKQSTDSADPPDSSHRAESRATIRPAGLLGLRRGALPVGLIASAAAVVAAGTIGGQVPALAAIATNTSTPTGTAASTANPTGAQTGLVSQQYSRTAIGQQGAVRSVMRFGALTADSFSPTSLPSASELTLVLDEVDQPAP